MTCTYMYVNPQYACISVFIVMSLISEMSEESHIKEDPLKGPFHEVASTSLETRPPKCKRQERRPKLDFDRITAKNPPKCRKPQERGQKRDFNCSVCGRSYQSRETLVKHSVKHTKEFVCRKCTQGFSDAESLQIHNDTRHGQQFLCSSCGKTVLGRRNFLSHFTTHEEKPWKCHYQACGMSFLKQKTLIDHINVHTGFKPYKCGTCTAKYAHAASLSRHKMSCGSKLVCPTCNREFSSPSALTDHKQGEHMMKSFVCRCGKRFRWRPNLSRHRKQCNITA